MCFKFCANFAAGCWLCAYRINIKTPLALTDIRAVTLLQIWAKVITMNCLSPIVQIDEYGGLCGGVDSLV